MKKTKTFTTPHEEQFRKKLIDFSKKHQVTISSIFFNIGYVNSFEVDRYMKAEKSISQHTEGLLIERMKEFDRLKNL
jgi:predicted DNA-binding protein with PD1-like motif